MNHKILRRIIQEQQPPSQLELDTYKISFRTYVLTIILGIAGTIIALFYGNISKKLGESQEALSKQQVLLATRQDTATAMLKKQQEIIYQLIEIDTNLKHEVEVLGKQLDLSKEENKSLIKQSEILTNTLDLNRSVQQQANLNYAATDIGYLNDLVHNTNSIYKYVTLYFAGGFSCDAPQLEYYSGVLKELANLFSLQLKNIYLIKHTPQYNQWLKAQDYLDDFRRRVDDNLSCADGMSYTVNPKRYAAVLLDTPVMKQAYTDCRWHTFNACGYLLRFIDTTRAQKYTP